ncbi:unnamed protein product [Bursaphelenchus okinawaensis]|uniref:Nuclear receptor domain-containing protein n=1 Tax=Bursaphelenchus okinawaensis TaxID=465554 RepID=A0A811KHT3_9BILA|nr:unnamed protein product [Bursaphelenchus okinawaensis]CAG9103514.1 unnamed protein product [Bursaphelenchus okinawaensis]
MGRATPAPVVCQICGDKSYGRHYGLWTCDGCACFFKRTIRRKINYRCISGDNNCPVDKTRRNWCPACRLNKCFQMQMNKDSVQKERGPRTKKLNKNLHKNLSQDIQNKVKLLVDTMKNVLHNAVIVFLSVEQKKQLLHQLWPVFTLAAIPHIQHSIKIRSVEINNLLANFRMKIAKIDDEEIRLLCSWLLCHFGSKIPTIDFASSLLDTYTLWIHKHCTVSYPDDYKRADRILEYGRSLIHFQHYSNLVEEFAFLYNPKKES